MIARIVAIIVMFLSAAVIVWHHRDDLFTTEEVAGDDPVAAAYRACIDARGGDIAKMKADGVIDEGRAALFLSRAEAFCRAEAEKQAPASDQ